MEISKRNRTELKSYFVKNSIPTESNFAELIDGTLNQKDDGIVKLAGDPLCIEASGDDTSQKKAVHFYQSFADLNPAWTLNLNPRRDPNDPGSATPGFNLGDGEGNSRLFIDRNTGQVGFGTTQPEAALDVRGSLKATSNVSGERELRLEAPNGGDHRGDGGTQAASGLAYRVTSNPGDGDPIFQVRSSGQAVRFFVEHNGWTGSTSNSAWFGGNLANYFAGSVGIGTSKPGVKLDVQGTLRADRYVIQDSVNGGGTKGLWMWNANDSNWGIYMGQAGDGRSLAGKKAVGGAGFTSHAVRLRTGSGSGNGLIYENQEEQLNLSIRANDGLTYIRGYVGIGTTSPDATLTLAANSSIKIIDPKNSDWGTTLGNDRSGNGTLSVSGRDLTLNTGQNETLTLNGGKAVEIGTYGGSDGVDRHLTVKSNGNVGIGTTSPQDKVDVHGVLRFNGNANTKVYGALRAKRNTVVLNGNWNELEVKGRVIDWSGSSLHIGYDNDHAKNYIEIGRKVGHLRFLSGGGTSETMRVTGGNVGIGTATPGSKLDVSGMVRATGGLRVDGSTEHIEADGAFYRHKNGQAYLTVDDNLYIRHKGGSVRVHFDTKNGRVGIGTTSPKAPLHVATRSGNIKGSNFRSGAGQTQYWSIGCYEWIGAQGVRTWSDARVKINPKPLSTQEALETISQLRLVDYQHIPEYLADVRGRGVYAQELREILPDAVSTFPSITLDNGKVIENFLSVDYEWIFVTGMAAIQELKKQHEQLRGAVQQLQSVFKAQTSLSA